MLNLFTYYPINYCMSPLEHFLDIYVNYRYLVIPNSFHDWIFTFGSKFFFFITIHTKFPWQTRFNQLQQKFVTKSYKLDLVLYVPLPKF